MAGVERMDSKCSCRVPGSGVLHRVLRYGGVTFPARESGSTFSIPNIPVSLYRLAAMKQGNEDWPQSQ